VNADDSTPAWLETGQGQRVALRGNFRFGRAPDNHLVINAAKASRHHAAIHAQDEKEFWLIDLGSSNGTYCNEHRLLRPTRLHDGDRIFLAGESFIFRQPSDLRAGQDSTRAGSATIVDFKEEPAWLLIADMESFTELSRSLSPDKLAISVGRWIHECHRLIERRCGRVSKYLGDGFLACWTSPAGTPAQVAAMLGDLRDLRSSGTVKFRVAVHHGAVTFGGSSESGEENMLGTEVNFVFRLEKLASELGVVFCVSTTAGTLLAPHLRIEPVPGEHELKGFAGRHRCCRIAWPD
jgi:adenylate cyclase